ncbi:sugar kinase [Streptomyces fradiae]|uniref:sugar kinase n=1 Tax=Streptomyces fradiae TaxID=1906 RepID=UPI00294248D4|nr:sugar kinase [Streptomyces fradiae]WOI62703.1 sugar kinase [Streptomyces fradiae]
MGGSGRETDGPGGAVGPPPPGRAVGGAVRGGTAGAPDVVCLGESMVAFLPSRPGRLADVPAFTRAVGGAESNTACALAAAGHRVRWISRVGADGFGDHLVAAVAAYGVDVSGVRRDPHRPTGVYFRTAADRAGAAHEVVYHRAGSAASAMSPRNVPYEEAAAGRVLHLTGITPALSPGCRDLVAALTARRPGRPLVSFDLNHRPALWPGPATARRVLLPLARGADLVFAGEDEAADALGLHGPDAVRQALPEPEVLVVKAGAAGATAFAREAVTGRDVRVRVPAPRVEVVSYAGAGDAFAAGYLDAALRGLPLAARLAHGHRAAAAVLAVPGDLAPPPGPAAPVPVPVPGAVPVPASATGPAPGPGGRAGGGGADCGRLRPGPRRPHTGPDDDEEVRTR